MSYNKETGLYEGYIYKITNLVNGKIYIGQTLENINKRWHRHILYSKKETNINMIIAKAIKKYTPQNFKIEELFKIEDINKQSLKTRINEKEIETISVYNSTNKDIGYNISKGGQNIGNKEKTVIVYNMDGCIVDSFDSCIELSNAYNISQMTISDICNGKTCNYKMKYVFRFKNDEFFKYPILNDYNYKVYQFSTDGKLIDVYNNCFEPYKKLGIEVRKDTLDNPRRLMGGFWWSTKKYFNFKGVFNNKRSVDVYDYHTLEKIDTCESILDASKKYNCSKTLVSRICNGKGIKTLNYIFRFSFDDLYKYPIRRISHNACKVYQLDLINNKVINEYDSYKEAQIAIGCANGKLIRKSCIGERKTNVAYGYKWANKL